MEVEIKVEWECPACDMTNLEINNLACAHCGGWNPYNPIESSGHLRGSKLPEYEPVDPSELEGKPTILFSGESITNLDGDLVGIRLLEPLPSEEE